MGLFDKKESISREEMKSFFKKDNGVIPKTGGEKYSYSERVKMTKEIFGSGYGSQISKSDYRSALNKLKSSRNRARDEFEKKEIEQKINYLKRIGK